MNLVFLNAKIRFWIHTPLISIAVEPIKLKNNYFLAHFMKVERFHKKSVWFGFLHSFLDYEVKLAER